MMRQVRASQSGFTLIELLTVISIIGILASIALLQVATFRKQAFDREAQIALRMVAQAEEAYFQRYEVYKPCDQDSCKVVLEGLPLINEGVVLQMSVAGIDCSGSAQHSRGTGAIFMWNS